MTKNTSNIAKSFNNFGALRRILGGCRSLSLLVFITFH